MANALTTPLIELGIRNPHYFEGRLLTAAALRADQDAHRARQRQLGRALGAGVVEGLEVAIEDPGGGDAVPVLRVAGGLALNAKGQALEIRKEREDIALTEPPKPLPPGTDLFKDCRPPSQEAVPTGEGVYVLVLSPASDFRERAPMSSLGDTEKSGKGCGSRWAIEGVQLRLEPFDPLKAGGLGEDVHELLLDVLGSSDLADLSLLRNVLAHLCFGTEALARWAADPFATEDGESALAAYGALDDLRAAGRLTDCDVPLALLYWSGTGVRFVDNWSVRRRPMPSATAEDWPTVSGGRRRAEAEAVLFQFQDQLAEMLAAATVPTAIRAHEWFRWLPPAGVVPVSDFGVRGVADPGFFQDLTRREPNPFMDGARLRDLLHVASSYPPIDLASPEMLWVYQIRQNHPPPPPGGIEHPYLAFASGFMPFFGTARFDVARWDNANYSSSLTGPGGV